MNIDFQKYVDAALDAVITYAPSLLSALVVLIAGFWAIKKINKVISLSLSKSSFSGEIASFFMSMADIAMKFAVVLFAAGIAGFDTSALVGILAAAGFAIGLALQGGLGNFASGIIILVFKPYKVGDWISLNDKFGKVEEIQIFNTILTTPGNKSLIVPNGKITDDVVTNYSKKGQIRLDIKLAMAYEESFSKVKSVIEQVLAKSDYVMAEENPHVIGIEAYDSHNLKLSVKPLVHPDAYWPATYKLHEEIKTAFSHNAIKVAYSEGLELGKIGE